MTTLTLEVRKPREAAMDFVTAWKGGRGARGPRIAFANEEILWRVLTAKRWELLKALCGAGPISIREAARLVGRDVKAVHGDITALLNAGIIERTHTRKIEFPYDAVKVEFMLRAA
jgi:predicted transcriptional regulator